MRRLGHARVELGGVVFRIGLDGLLEGFGRSVVTLLVEGFQSLCLPICLRRLCPQRKQRDEQHRHFNFSKGV